MSATVKTTATGERVRTLRRGVYIRTGFYLPDHILKAILAIEDELPPSAASYSPSVPVGMAESAARFKKMFVPITYADADGDSLAVRMCKKVYNLTAHVKHRGTALTDDELRTINSAAFAGIEGDESEPVC